MSTEIHVSVAQRVCTSDTVQINNGDTSYILFLSFDYEWPLMDTTTCRLNFEHEDGSTTSGSFEVTGSWGVQIGVPDDAVTLTIGVVGEYTTSGVTTTIAAQPVSIRCLPQPEQEESAAYTRPFDVYNWMLDYANGSISGTMSSDYLAVIMQTLENYRATLPVVETFPSAEYRLTASAPMRQTQLKGKITLKNGTEIEIDAKSVSSDSVGLHVECMTDDYILPGSVSAKELTFDLLGIDDPDDIEDAKVEMSYWIHLINGRWYEVPIGEFWVAMTGDASVGGALPITAYDAMYKLGSIPVSSLGIEEETEYTPQDIITMCAEAGGIAYTGNVSGYLNGNLKYVLSNLGASVETARDLLMHTVQTLCAFAYVDRFGELKVKQLFYAEPAVTLTDRNRTNLTAERLQYRPYQIQMTVEYPDDYDNGNTTVRTFYGQTLYDSGVTTEMPENKLFPVVVSDPDQGLGRTVMISNAVQAIAYLMNGLNAFEPLTGTIYGDPALEPFEWITHKKGSRTIKAPVTSYDWRYSSAQAITTCGRDAVAGVITSQTQKAASAAQGATIAAFDNYYRYAVIQQIVTQGHAAMQQYTHATLAKFKHGELDGSIIVPPPTYSPYTSG